MFGLAGLSSLTRSVPCLLSLPPIIRNFLLTLPCSDFQEEGFHNVRSSASYNVRCTLDNLSYLAVFATSEADKSASNLWDEHRGWLTGLKTDKVRQVLALAVDPLTENIFYIMDIDRGESLASLCSRVSQDQDGSSQSQSQSQCPHTVESLSSLVRSGCEAALSECTHLGLTYPGLRPDRVWIVKGEVLLENGLVVKGGIPGQDLTTLIQRIAGEPGEPGQTGQEREEGESGQRQEREEKFQ